MTKRLSKNEITPNFSTADLKDSIQSPDLYHGKKWMLSFYRYASCAMCNLREHQLTLEYGSWEEKGFRILGVFESSADSIQQNVGKQNAPYPIIPNPDLSLYQTYSLDSS